MVRTSATGVKRSHGEPKGIEIEPETAIPASKAAFTQSANPATLSSGVLFRFARLWPRLAETFSLTFLQPHAAARSTPRRFAINARSSTPGTFPKARYNASVSAICGTALGLTKEPSSITGKPDAMMERASAILSARGSSAFSFCRPSRRPTSQRVILSANFMVLLSLLSEIQGFGPLFTSRRAEYRAPA